MTTPNIKILYIEDDPEARYLMADIIRYKGFIYLEADRGLEGIRLAQKHLPNLILIDLHLPDLQGNEVTTHIKNLPGLKETPIIALTAASQKDVKEMVLTAGCDGYISKPINVTEFLHKIDEYLAGRKDKIKADDEQYYLQKYNIQLVNRLKKKIVELESLNLNLTNLNDDLFDSRKELSRYNDKLFYLNNLANFMRTLHDPIQMLEILPGKLIEGFQVERCLVFERQEGTPALKLLYSAGFKGRQALRNKPLRLSDTSLQFLKSEGGIIWFKDDSEILDSEFLNIAHQLNSSSFIITNLASLGTQSERIKIYDSISLVQESSSDSEQIRDLIIFIDKGKTKNYFATYEIRILKSFLQTSGIIYENMTLYSHVVQLYKIKADEAIHDGMTKVYNYRYFIQELEREVNRSRRFERPFSLLMIDIDHFKQYNDQHGHLEGDKALSTIARLLDQNTRTTDTVARYGGEEFAIILPGLCKKEALIIAQKLQHLIATYHFPDILHSECCRLTISIGVSCLPVDAAEPRFLLATADHNLYRAKSLGRNTVSYSQDS
jgi:diguanylate cyclase (GGDEF)-like protein